MFKLLNFAVTNHKSIRERQEISFLSNSLKTLIPKDNDTWDRHFHKTLAIYGANASGKSNIIDALNYALSALKHSSTTWRNFPVMLRYPFKIDPDFLTEPSVFEFEFLYNDRLYSYEFKVSDEGIIAEKGACVPNRRWKKLLDKNYEYAPQRWLTMSEFIREDRLKSPNANEEELALALREMVKNIEILPYGEEYISARLANTVEEIFNNRLDLDNISTLLQLADVGINKVDVEEEHLPPAVANRLAKVFALLEEDGHDSNKESDISQDLDLKEDAIKQVISRGLVFYHSSESGNNVKLMVGEESRGTISWLASIIPAIEVLKTGGLYVVDELDAGLHPMLLETFVQIFTNEEININGAQLLFTCHNPYLLSPTLGFDLVEEQIWFTEKNEYGASTIYSLADYPKRKDANYMKRYLAGRYGALPNTTTSLIYKVLEEKSA